MFFVGRNALLLRTPPNVLMVRFSFVGVSPLQTLDEPMAVGGLIPTYD